MLNGYKIFQGSSERLEVIEEPPRSAGTGRNGAVTISHYQILEKLGEGGMGIVYKAEDLELQREVAIKFLPRQVASQGEDRARFRLEARAEAALNHPNIVTIYAIEEVDDEMFIVMEYLDGQDLMKVVRETDLPRLPLDVVLNFALQIAEGLQAAHDKGVIHRDIKSANIMVTECGRTKIMDFGLAKLSHRPRLTTERMAFGTMAYMSPEQICGGSVDLRTDIWSWGVVLYEMLTGQLPFQDVYEQAIVYSILNEDSLPVSEFRQDVPTELADILNRALHKEPKDRFEEMEGLIQDLRALRLSPTIHGLPSEQRDFPTKITKLFGI